MSCFKKFLSVLFALLILVTISCKRPEEKRVAPTGVGNVTALFLSPKGPVDRPQSIVATFSAPMVSITTIGKLEQKGPLKITPEVMGSFHWMGTNTVSFLPDKPLPFATVFTVEVDSKAADIEGNGLKEPVKWEFQTARPKIVSTYPAANAIGITLDENILIVFNQPVSPIAVKEKLTIDIKPKTDTEDKFIATKFDVRTPSEAEWKELTDSKSAENLDRAVIVIPAGKFAMAETVRVTVAADFIGTEGTLTLGEVQKFQFTTFAPLKVDAVQCAKSGSNDYVVLEEGKEELTDCDPKRALDIAFNNNIIPKDSIKYFSINPQIEISNSDEWPTSSMSLWADFMPNTKYEVTVSKDITDEHGNSLGQEKKFAFMTGNLAPQMFMAQGLGVLEMNGPQTIGVNVTNIKTIDVEYYNIGKEKLVSVIKSNVYEQYNYRDAPDASFTPTVRDLIEPKLDVNKSAVQEISVVKGLAGKKSGVLLLTVSSPEDTYSETDKDGVQVNKRNYLKTLVQVTDLGITGKFYDSGALIWVTSLSKGEPVSGAAVELRNDENKVVWKGSTDARGLVTAKDVTFNYVFVEKNGDLAFTSASYEWSRGFEPWDFDINESGTSSSAIGFVFTERGIYKPGETIHLKAIVRSAVDSGMAIPDADRVVIEARDARGRVYYKEESKLNEYGSSNADIKIPDYTATGNSSINITLYKEAKSLASFYKNVLVAVYEPAEFKVSMEPSADDYISGEAISVDLQANYLFGEPMANAGLNWSIFKSREWFWAKDFEAYSFGIQTYFDEDDSKEFGFMELEGSSDGKLSANGEYKIIVPSKATTVKKITGYSIEGTVTDINKQSISDRTYVIVHPGQFYIGLKIPSFLVTAGTPFDLNLITVDTKGALVTGKYVGAKLYKREWHSVRKKAVVGYVYETKPEDIEVGTCSVTTEKEPSVCGLQADKAGIYVIKATSKDSVGNTIESSIWFYVTGSGEAGWKPEPHDRIELVLDKKKYKPGETAKVMIKSPFNKAQALLTYERSGVMHQETRELIGNTPTIEIPLTDKFMPNFFFSAVLVEGRTSEELSEEGEDAGRPQVKVGYINIPVESGSKKLKVEVTTDKKIASPGSEVEISVNVKDQEGKPVKGEVTIMVVDEGSLILTGYKTPEPFRFFYAEAGLGVTTTDTRVHLISRRHFGEKGEANGGGGALAAKMGADDGIRRKFLTVAYWNPSVITDETGIAKVSFTLPDNLTTFKVMAVVDTKDKFGNGDAEVTSKKPFMVRATLPKFVAIGDTFEASVVLHNYTDKALTGKLTGAAVGLTLQGESEREFVIEPEGKQEIFFTFQALELGQARLEFKADTDAGSDGVEVPLGVRVTHPTEIFTSYAETDKSGNELLEPLENVYPDLGGLDVSLSSTALTGLTDASLYLINYKYECLEQKISKAIGMMTYSKMLKAFEGFDEKKIEGYDKIIERTLFELYAYQGWDGGFGFWKGMNSDPYLSIYTTYFIHLAGTNSYAVDDSVVGKSKAYLKELLRWDAKQKKMSVEYLDSLKAYALYVLSLSGEPETAYYEKLYAVKDTLSLGSRVQLMIAMKKDGVGTEAQYDEFLRYLNNQLVVTTAEAHVGADDGANWWLRSSDYTNAYVIMAFLELDPSQPHLSKMVRYLMANAKSGYWISTHTTAAVLVALYDYMSEVEGDTNYNASVKLGPKEVLTAKFEGKTDKEESSAITMKELLELVKEPTELIFEKDGEGKLYYRTRLTYASNKSPLPPMEEGFTIYKSYKHYDETKKDKPFMRGDIIKVSLDFVSIYGGDYVVINDALPAGLEAVNFSLQTAKQHMEADSSDNFYISHVEVYGDRVLTFANYVPAGSYHYEYIARVTTKGDFAVPPAHIEEMYNPELFGRTMTWRMKIEQ